MKRSILSLGLAIAVLSNNMAQDTASRQTKMYRITLKGENRQMSKGYLAMITDSVLYVSASPVPVNLMSINPAFLKPFDYGSINTVSLRRKGSIGRGLWKGALIGTVIGVIAGLASGNDDPNKDWFAMTAGEKAFGLGITGAVGGGLIGTIIGAVARKKFIINGKKEKFREMQLSVLERIYANGSTH
jgi:membrane associated rhomboid family serine protease